MKTALKQVKEGIQVIRGFDYKGEKFFINDIFQQGDVFYKLCEGDVCFYLEQFTDRKDKIVKVLVDERFTDTNEITIDRILYGDFKRIGNLIDDYDQIREITDNERRR